ncbi:helix-turn-helix domain-containing protein [Lactobacillus sp. AN1001]
MKKFGEVFKYFREAKNMSLREVAGKDFSASQISRFERGQTEINIEAFYHCLHAMNISMSEFEEKYNEFNYISDSIYGTKISEAYLERNISKLVAILKDELNSDTGSSKLNSIIIKIAIFMCDSSKKIHKRDIEYLSDYLFSINDWNSYEIWLFGNSIFILPSKTLEVLGYELINILHSHKNSEKYKRKIYVTLLNIISCFLERNEMELALKFLISVENTDIPESEMYIKVIYKYTKLIYLHKTGDVSALSKLIKITDFLEFIDCFSNATRIKKYLSNCK